MIRCLVVVGLLLAGSAQDTAPRQASLEQDLKGKIFFLRDFSQKGNIQVSADGTPLDTGKPGSWTTSLIEVKEVEVNGGEVVISGNRLGLFRDSRLNKLVPTRTGSRVTVRVRDGLSSEKWREYFISDEHQLKELVPPVFKGFLEGKFRSKPEKNKSDANGGQQVEVVDGISVFRVGGKVKSPKPVSTPDLAIPDPVLKYRIRGISVLHLIVGVDGKPSHIEVKDPLGMGVDEQAITAVQQWRFKPATKDGVPVAVRINVEFNYSLPPD